jgi:hypothetical protein
MCNIVYMFGRQYIILMILLVVGMFVSYRFLTGTAQSIAYLVCSLTLLVVFFRRVQQMSKTNNSQNPK